MACTLFVSTLLFPDSGVSFTVISACGMLLWIQGVCHWSRKSILTTAWVSAGLFACLVFPKTDSYSGWTQFLIILGTGLPWILATRLAIHTGKQQRSLAELSSQLEELNRDMEHFRALNADEWKEAKRFVANQIFERKRIEKQKSNTDAQLRHSQKMGTVGAFAGSIVHDFNNLLQAILGYSDIAHESLPLNHTTRKDLEEIMEAANRARELIRQILTFSHQKDQRLHPVDVRQVIDDALKIVTIALPSNIHIERQLCVDPIKVLANSLQLHQVIVNLCNNSIHAMEERNGVINIGLDQRMFTKENMPEDWNLEEGRFVKIMIKDDGKGMERTLLDHIFEPFFTTKEAGKGTGLGLSVAHNIIRSYSGEIQVESEAGVGSTVTLWLPEYIDPKKESPNARSHSVSDQDLS